MRRKKLLVALLAMAVSATMLGCKKEDTKEAVQKETVQGEAKKDVTITIWHQYLPEVQKNLETAFEGFTAETGIKVKFEKQEDIDNKIDIASRSGKMPDMIVRSHDMVGKLAIMGAIQPIDELVSKDELSGMIDTTVKAFTYQDKLYGIPAHLETWSLYYNKDLIQETPKTMDELLQKTKELTKDGNYGFVIPPSDTYFNAFFLKGNKNKFVTEDGKAALDTPENLESFKFMQQMSAYYPKGLDHQMVSKLFTEGKAAMMVSGPWDIGNVKKVNMNYGVALLPSQNDGTPSAPFVGVQGPMLTTGCKDKEAAAKVLKYFLTENASMAYVKSGGYLPALSKMYEKDELKNNADFNAFKAQAEVGVPTPNIPEFSAANNPATDALQAAIVIKEDAKKTLEQFQKRAEEAINNMK